MDKKTAEKTKCEAVHTIPTENEPVFGFYAEDIHWKTGFQKCMDKTFLEVIHSMHSP